MIGTHPGYEDQRFAGTGNIVVKIEVVNSDGGHLKNCLKKRIANGKNIFAIRNSRVGIRMILLTS